MADDSVPTRTPKKKRGLPPISPRADTENNDTEVKPVKRKPKKKTTGETTANGHTSPTQDENKPTPRRRRKRSPSQAKDQGEEEKQATESTTAAPRKKKRKPKADSGEADKSQSADTEATTQAKDGQGSKTSLISKDEATPRKKVGKKKKKVKKTVADSDDFGDSPWAEDLRTMKEDIITGDAQEEEEVEGEGEEAGGKEKKQPVTSFIAPPILRSQPLDKIFIETSTKFKGQSKVGMMRQRAAEPVTEEPKETKRMTTIDFALSTHSVFRVITLFLHGLVGGLGLWQMVIVFELSRFSNDDFLDHYNRIAMPLQASYYFLLALCTVSACDRFDIGNPTRRFVLRALTLQNGAIAIVIYVIALILSLVAIRYDDRMTLYRDYQELYENENMKADDIDTFKSLNAARSVLVILAWLVLAITPNSDRLGKSLRSGETGLERELEMDKVSTA